MCSKIQGQNLVLHVATVATIKKHGLKKFQQQVFAGVFLDCRTLHANNVILKNTKNVYSSKTFIQQLQPLSSLPNSAALLDGLWLLHRLIKRRDSPFASLKDKDAVRFQSEMMGCSALKQLLHGDRGLSGRRIGQLIQSIFDLVFLGIYIEMTNCHLK